MIVSRAFSELLAAFQTLLYLSTSSVPRSQKGKASFRGVIVSLLRKKEIPWTSDP